MVKRIPLILLFFTSFIFAQGTVDQLEFSGLKRTKERFLRRLIKVKPNTVLDTLKVAEDVERLKRLPGIASASYALREENDRTIVRYDIVENFTIIPGLRISNDVNGDFAFRVSAFEFNFLGNNQLVGGFYARNVFDSFGFFYEHPFLFSDKLGLGFSYQDQTTQEPVFFDEGTKDYRFNSRAFESNLLFFFDFNNEAELGVSFINESYNFIGDTPIPGAPTQLAADKIAYRLVYRYVNVDIDYQYIDGISSEFTGQYFTFTDGGEESQRFLGDFLSLRNDFIYYKKIKKNGNWASRLRLAGAIGNSDSPFAPFTLDNQLNIRGVGNTVDRGIAAIVLNTEYRHTFYEKGWFAVQGNAFLDAGSWQNPGENFSELFSGSNLRVFPGLGFRLIHKRIFNAVFRLDYGFGVAEDGSNGIVFGIGQYF
ncbi:MAG: POTRA domain-containing protein [Bacteroidota bacterium]